MAAVKTSLKIIETVCEDPIRMIPKPGISFEPGMVVKTSLTEDGTLICDVADDNLSIGIVGNYIKVKAMSYRPKDMVRVWSARMIFRTDRYDISSQFSPGAAIYVKNGYLTTRKPSEESRPIARITMVPKENNKTLEALWL